MMIMSHHDVEQTSRIQKWSRLGMENIDDVKNYNSIERPWLSSVVLHTQVVLQLYHRHTQWRVPCSGPQASCAVKRGGVAVECGSVLSNGSDQDLEGGRLSFGLDLKASSGVSVGGQTTKVVGRSV